MAPFGATTSDQADLSIDAARLAAVKLDRYTAGGMEPAKNLVTNQMHRRFYALKKAETKASEQKVAATR
ncbi:hypothetical protein N9V84_06945 [Verrucomicrobiales bacterium]|jgi:hypothetical protein|nr:hypothetical protein [Verrucomicrobiales bacterium]